MRSPTTRATTSSTPAKCNSCNDCISPCPTGAIDNWRQVDKASAYTLAEQLAWDTLPAQADAARRAPATPIPTDVARITVGRDRRTGRRRRRRRGRPRTLRQPLRAGEARDGDGHRQLSADRATARAATSATSCSTSAPPRFPCSRARRSASCRPAWTRTAGRTTCGCTRSPARATASARATTTSSLTVKRVTEDHDGKPVRGVASNLPVRSRQGRRRCSVVGPYGTSFLMPNHPGSSLLMICTGTGSAPMRAMTERRRRRIALKEGGKLMLFFGARAAGGAALLRPAA